MNDEKKMIDRYEHHTQTSVTKRNDHVYTLNLAQDVTIYGRVDGIVESEGLLIEHKRRIRCMMEKVPYHERVQCHLYMKMTGLKKAHLVETFGDHLQIHEIAFDENVWEEIRIRCLMLSNFIFKDQTING